MKSIYTVERIGQRQSHRKLIFWIFKAILPGIIFGAEFQADEQSPIATLTGHNKAVNSISVSPDGKYCVSTSTDSTIRIWDLNSFIELNNITAQKTVILSAVFLKNSSMIISGGMENTGKIWDVKSGTLMHTLRGHEIEIRAVAYSKRKNYLATGSTDHSTIIWNFATGQRLKTIHNKMPVIALDFSPNGNYLAAGGWENNVEIWDLAWSDVCKIGYGHRASVRSVKFSPDGMIVASGSEDQTIRIWNPLSAECIEIIAAHDNFITAIDFSSDGRLLVSVSFDKTVRLWDTYSWQLIRTIHGYEDGITSVSFTKDSKYIISGDNLGVIKIWGVEPIGQAMENLLKQKNTEVSKLTKMSPTTKPNQALDQKNIEAEKRIIEEKYALKFNQLKEQKKNIIRQSVKQISMPVSQPGKYNKDSQTLELIVVDQILAIKALPWEAKTLLAQWYKIKVNGYVQLDNSLLRYEYHFSEIEHTETGSKYKVIRQQDKTK